MLMMILLADESYLLRYERTHYSAGRAHLNPIVELPIVGLLE